jgi:hypothetical protein
MYTYELAFGRVGMANRLRTVAPRVIQGATVRNLLAHSHGDNMYSVHFCAYALSPFLGKGYTRTLTRSTRSITLN